MTSTTPNKARRRVWIILVVILVIVVVAVVVGLLTGVPETIDCMTKLWPGHNVSLGDALGVCTYRD